MQTISIEELIDQVAKRDRKALGALYDRTSASLFGVALGILRDTRAAEDALQNAYVRLWRTDLPRGDGAPQGMAWLTTIVRQAAIDEARKRRTLKLDYSPPVTAKANGVNGGTDVSGATDNGADYNLLSTGLEQLDKGQQSLFRKAFFEARTYADLAQTTSTPLGAVKSAIRRSLLVLHDHLEPKEPEPQAEATDT